MTNIEQRFQADMLKVFPKSSLKDTGRVQSIAGTDFNIDKFIAIMAIHGFVEQYGLFPNEDGEYYIEKASDTAMGGYIYGIVQTDADTDFLFEFSGY